MEFYRSLSNFFVREYELCEQLIALLKQEHQYLRDRNIIELSQVTQFKQEKLHLLESVSAQREILIRSFKTQGATEKQTLEFILQHAPKSINKALNTQWQELTKVLQQCKYQNELNGRVINRSKQVVERMLMSLQGNRNAAETYNKKGQTSSPFNQGASIRA